MTGRGGGTGSGRALVGRDVEVGELVELLETAAAGTGRAVAVTGEPGIGKTALVEAVAGVARHHGLLVHWARCFEIGGAPALWPWSQLLRDVLTADLAGRLDGPARAAASLLAPDVTDPGDARTAPRLDTEENRFRVADGMLRILEAAARDAPRLFVMEDCHAADLASLHLLHFVLAQTTGRAAYLFVATYRDVDAPAEAAPMLAEVSRAALQLRLRGLDHDALVQLVQPHVGARLSEEEVSGLHDVTGGNPLFARVLARHLGPSGDLGALAGRGTVPVPESLRELFAGWLARLEPPVRRPLTVLAAAGRTVDPALARLLVGDDVAATIDAGLREGLLEEVDAAGSVRFAHALVAAALLDELATEDRQEVHRWVAEAIEEMGDRGRPRLHLAALAHHYGRAGPTAASQAFAMARAAGDQAHAMGAFADAARYYQMAMEAAAEAGATELEQAAVLGRLGDARIRSGDVEGGRRECRSAWEMARRAGDTRAMADAALSHARIPEGGVVNEDTVRMVTGALAAIGDAEPGLRARLRARLAAELVLAPADDTREVLAREAVDEARSTGDPFVIFWTARFASTAVSMPDNFATCLAWCNEAVAAAEVLDDPAGKADAIAYRSFYNLSRGDLAAYLADMASLSQLAHSVPTPLNRWYVTVSAACRALIDGRFDEAATNIEAGLGFSAAIPNAIACWQYQLYSLALDRGEPSTLAFEPMLTAALDLRPGLGPLMRSALLLIQTMDGRLAEAAAGLPALTDELLERRLPLVWLLALRYLAEVAWRTESAEPAGRLYDALRPHEDLHVVGTSGTPAAYGGSVHRPLAWLSLAMGDADRAVTHAERALAAHARLSSPPFAARSQAELAEALLVRGAGSDASRAAALLREAGSTARRLGMAPLQQAIGDLEARLASSPHRAATAAATGQSVGQSLAPPVRLVNEGDYWTLSAGGRDTRLRDAKGVRYLAQLLRQPERPVHALDLAGPRDRSSPRFEESADAMLDDRARRAYQQRLRDLEEDIEEADRTADLGQAARLKEERDFLIEELKRAAGLGGASRTLGTSPQESARIAVTKALRGIIKKIEAADPELGRHLRATVRTGTFCVYTAELEATFDWTVQDG